MQRTPVGPRRSPGAPQPGSGRTFSGVRSPFGGSPRHRGVGFLPGFSPGSPRFSPGSPRFSPGSPRWSPGSGRGNMDVSPAQFGGGGRWFAGPVRPGRGFRRPQSFSPSGAPNLQSRTPDVPVEKYFSPSMLQDPWKSLPAVPAENQRTS
ncbi:M-phase-specific PLK1-interacting protein [Fundulus heteroclitus]|uniref:M-phase-specific PLK1-interacting protein n=1 Tax=Fundulus heteroclitus TaxID=8078 RepID=UPI00165A4B5B|nr:M-phase-specific PLK1-interacting protein [Fundulus heteroclitus]